MYVKIVNGTVNKFPYSLADLKKDNPNVSFASNIDTDTLSSYGVYVVDYQQDPEYNYRTHRLVPQQPTLIDGKWTVTKSIVSKTQAEIDTDNAQKSLDVRQNRDRLLAATDWRFRSDMTPSQAWIEYCQALRDIPQQEGFPWDVTYPSIPE